MPLEVRWLVEHQVFYQRIYGEAILQDVDALWETFQTYMDDSQTPWYVIIDGLDITKVSVEFKQALNKITSNQAPTHIPDATVVVVNNTALRFMGTVISNFLKETYHFVKTRREAVDYLVAQNSQLAGQIVLED